MSIKFVAKSKKKLVYIFFALSLLWTYICLFPKYLDGLGLHYLDRISFISSFFLFGPALCCIGVCLYAGGVKELTHLLKRVVTINTNYKWYIISPGICIIVGMLSNVIYIIVTKDTNMFVNNFSDLSSILGKIAFLSATALLEEFSWRGFAIFELQKSWNSNKSAIVTSVIWAIWHIPMWYVMNGSSLTVVILSLVMAISTGIIIVLFYNVSGGNVLTGVLVHLFLNTSFIWDGKTVTLYVINDIVLVIGATIAIIVFRCGDRNLLSNAHKGFVSS